MNLSTFENICCVRVFNSHKVFLYCYLQNVNDLQIDAIYWWVYWYIHESDSDAVLHNFSILCLLSVVGSVYCGHAFTNTKHPV